MLQLDFFETEYIVKLREDNMKTQESLTKTRRALFARSNELQSKLEEALNRLEIIERNICKGL